MLVPDLVPTPVEVVEPKQLSDAQMICKHVCAYVSNFMEILPAKVELNGEIKKLRERNSTYAGDIVSAGHLKVDLEDLDRCLLPEELWPAETPRGKVHATDAVVVQALQTWSPVGHFRRDS